MIQTPDCHKPMKHETTIWHLEMLSPSQLVPSKNPPANLKMVQLPVPMPEINRFFYTSIGGDWFWMDRLSWSYPQWWSYLNRPELQTWLFHLEGVPIGYCELEQQDESVELVYFGLLAPFVGQGRGGAALTLAVQQAWAGRPKRVWVHTCDLDHPGAKRNYLSRGFVEFKIERKWEELPEVPTGPWPHSGKVIDTWCEQRSGTSAPG
jgi:RimJ/RimL family protein N-acetyltransferase